MSRVAVVTDSVANLPSELVERYSITVIPLLVAFGQEVFRDGVDMTPDQFYRRLREDKHLPTTSTPSMGDFLTLFHRLVGATGRFGPHRIVRTAIRDRAAARRSVDRILEWDFRRVVVSHGEVIEEDGRVLFAEAFAFLPLARS